MDAVHVFRDAGSCQCRIVVDAEIAVGEGRALGKSDEVEVFGQLLYLKEAFRRRGLTELLTPSLPPGLRTKSVSR